MQGSEQSDKEVVIAFAKKKKEKKQVNKWMGTYAVNL